MYESIVDAPHNKNSKQTSTQLSTQHLYSSADTVHKVPLLQVYIQQQSQITIVYHTPEQHLTLYVK